MHVSDEIKEQILARSGRRCECVSEKCRHHRGGSRCPKGLRPDQWQVHVRSETAGDQLWNLDAWCDACYQNNVG